ncbi:MAG: PorP/SprF family type IX secretion system membrane protein [Cytophagaceae bacterium]
MKKIILLFSFLLLVTSIQAQDIHFSQFYNFPLALNPALTGKFKQDYRLSAIYRNQWHAANATFQTAAFAGDVNFRVNPLSDDKIGVGLFFYNDQMGEGIIQNNSGYASLAYHKVLDKYKRHRLSAGLQGGYVRKSIDYSQLYFGSQIIDYEVSRDALSGENMDNNSFGYMNINAGLSWSFMLTDHTEIHSGISVFNAVHPKETFAQEFLREDLNRLKNRSLINIGMHYRMNERLSLMPEVMFMLQQRARDINIGAALGYHIGGWEGKTMVMAGTWYRVQDAAIFMAGVQHGSMKMVFSYDATVSPLRNIRYGEGIPNNARIGAYEITLTHVGFLNRPAPNNYTVPCGIF